MNEDKIAEELKRISFYVICCFLILIALICAIYLKVFNSHDIEIFCLGMISGSVSCILLIFDFFKSLKKKGGE